MVANQYDDIYDALAGTGLYWQEEMKLIVVAKRWYGHPCLPLQTQLL